MLNITLSSDATVRLYSILKEEDDNACVRVREFKVGTPNNPLKIVLSLSIDERDEEDVEGEAEAMPFIMNRELVEQYGINLAVSVDANRVFEVNPVPPGARPRFPLIPDQDEQILWQNTIFLP